jgi:hypothetical protein
MIFFSSRDGAVDEFRERLAEARHAENPCFLRVILLAYQTRMFPKKQTRRDRAAKPQRELPCFSEQEKTRALNHLSA